MGLQLGFAVMKGFSCVMFLQLSLSLLITRRSTRDRLSLSRSHKRISNFSIFLFQKRNKERNTSLTSNK